MSHTAARWSAVRPLLSTSFTSAPNSRSSSTTSGRAALAAICRGVRRPTSRMLTRAPRRSKNCKTASERLSRKSGAREHNSSDENERSKRGVTDVKLLLLQGVLLLDERVCVCVCVCGAVRCCAVRCGAVRCGAVLCCAVRCGAVRCGAVRCCAVRCGVVCVH